MLSQQKKEKGTSIKRSEINEIDLIISPLNILTLASWWSQITSTLSGQLSPRTTRVNYCTSKVNDIRVPRKWGKTFCSCAYKHFKDSGVI